MAQRITGAARAKVARLGAITAAMAVVAVVLAALMCVAPVRALAIGVPDTSRSCTLTVECASGEEAVAGARIELYRVAELDEYGHFSLLDEFADSGVDLDGIDRASAWSQAARKLEISAKLSEVAPSVVATTSSDGVAAFSGLACGLYLAGSADGTAAGGQTYGSSAFLVSLPGQSADGESWVYRVTVAPKFEKTGDESDKKDRDGEDSSSEDGNDGNNSSSQGRDARNGTGGLAGTGDVSPIAAAAGIALIGIALMAASRLRA